MNDKHLPLKVQFVHVMPSIMLQPFARLKRTDPGKIDAQVNLCATMIFDGMRIHPVCLQSTRERDKLIVHNAHLQPRFTFLVQLYCFALELVRLT